MVAAVRRVGTRDAFAGDIGGWGVPVERLTCLCAIHPVAPMQPPLNALPGFDEAVDRRRPLVDIVRARLSGFGPLPVPVIARALAVPVSSAAFALTRLEVEGYVMRGRFTPGATGEEWCERHLLARIHRYTVRREIEPVELQDFMRFLFDWQHVSVDAKADPHGDGHDALMLVIEQLEGYEAPAVAWEDEILPARLSAYSMTWLDDLYRSGKVVWSRPGARSRSSGGPVRTTPIVLLPLRNLAAWNPLMQPVQTSEPSSRAQLVFDALTQHGAMFFDELRSDIRLLDTELENAPGELVSLGLVNTDSFAGHAPQQFRPATAARRLFYRRDR